MPSSKYRIFVDFSLPESAMTILRDGTSGHELVFPDSFAASSLANAPSSPRLFEADIAFGQPDANDVLRASQLRWVHISTAGITRYDTPDFRQEATARGLKVSNSSSVYAEPCAEHVFSFMLAQARQLPNILESRITNADPGWMGHRAAMVSPRGQSVVILGYGAIAHRLVALLQPFEMNITAFRRRARGDEGVPVVSFSDLPAVLAEADHVINILPASKETDHFCDANFFASVKKGSIFYNIGRGTTVDHDALVPALRSGQVGAAWLDVTEPEPLPEGHPLWQEPNFYFTPHVAGGHQNEKDTLVRHFLKNFYRFQRGEDLSDRVL